MRSPSIYTNRRSQLDVKMTPMIDVVFLLLIFFVWTASFQIVEYVLPSSLQPPLATAAVAPTEPPPPEADFDDVVVRIYYAGQTPSWTLNEARLESLENLQQRLAQIAKIRRAATVILHPDPNTPLEHVIDAYDTARLAGFESVSFAVSSPTIAP